MTPPDWASQRVEKVSSDGFSGDAWAVSADECARLLRLEHARDVKIVKRRDAWLMGGGYDNMSNDFQAGYHMACMDLLTALQRGRGGKG